MRGVCPKGVLSQRGLSQRGFVLGGLVLGGFVLEGFCQYTVSDSVCECMRAFMQECVCAHDCLLHTDTMQYKY